MTETPDAAQPEPTADAPDDPLAQALAAGPVPGVAESETADAEAEAERDAAAERVGGSGTFGGETIEGDMNLMTGFEGRQQ